MANDKLAPSWRNFRAWGVVGAIFYILAVSIATLFLHQNAMEVMESFVRPTKFGAELGVGLLLGAAVTGFTSRKRPLNLRTLRNFLIQNAVAIIFFVLVIWGFSALARTASIGASGWAAAITGATLVLLAIFGCLATAITRTDLNIVEDELAAEEMRERGRSFFYGFAWMAALGSLLVGLSLSGPGGLLSPAVALTAVLVLVALLVVLGIAARRLSDELGRTLSRESGNIAFYLILLFGSCWAILAHLGFTAAPAPLDWLTLLTLLMFAAAFIATARRNLLTR